MQGAATRSSHSGCGLDAGHVRLLTTARRLPPSVARSTSEPIQAGLVTRMVLRTAASGTH